MPQLDPTYYFSQIFWLLTTFGCFFCISKFLILPQLDRILSKRTDLVATNTQFAKDILEKVNVINKSCEEQIIATSEKNNEEIAVLIKQMKSFNSKKIDELNKKFSQDNNKNILQLRQELQSVYENIDNEIIQIIATLIKNVYALSPNIELIKKIFSTKRIVL